MTLAHKNKHLSYPLLAGLSIFAFGACGATPPAVSEVPPSLEGPIQGGDAQQGAMLFEQHCAGGICHGDGAGPDLTELSVTPGQVRAQVRSGRGAMPAISEMDLSDANLEHILAHLKERGTIR